MASIKRGDTWPPLRGKAEDEDGLIDMTAAESVKVILKHGATVVQGTVEILDPPDDDGFNWRYTWAATDTAVVGEYSTELEITWDTSTTPDRIETVPNGDNPTLEIVQDNG